MALLEACAVLVDASGPDPRQVKANYAAFHEAKDGITTLSASGTLLPTSEGAHQLVGLPASTVFPFLRQSARSAFPAVTAEDLIPSVRFRVSSGRHSCDAHFKGAFTIASSLAAQQHLLNSSHEWCAGRLLAPGASGNASYPPAVHASLAVLEVQGQLPQGAEATWSNREHAEEPLRQGQQVWACGTPFGSMSPRHFQSCWVGGHIANAVHDKDGSTGLHLLDLYSLPGMEGGPIADSSGALVGLLGPVLSHTTFQAQVSTLIPAASVLLSLRQWLQQTAASKLQRASLSMQLCDFATD
ncbi:hypothetical protein WJX73_001052 [Symbiochloris irregularis]|uniref:Uncharacterized protein n=1 Tax=Symbiochloris irregularis TaxID=706552 RepID=A0AAW1PYX4_9CHLO